MSVLPVSPSDHLPVFTTVDLPKISSPPPVMHSVRHIKSINREEPELPTTLDELLECYATLTRLLDKHAPLIIKQASSRPFNPWYTPFLSGLKAKGGDRKSVAQIPKDSYHLMCLRQIFNFHHYSVVLAKQAYNEYLINDCHNHANYSKL